jgi:Flp pilus assembly protein TadG
MRLPSSRGFKKTTGNRRGQSMIEFSLAAPLLLVIATGMLWFGFALYEQIVLTNGVNAGALVLALSRGQTTDPCATGTTAVENAAPSLSTSKLSFTFVINGTSYSSTTCTGGVSNMVQGATVQVSANYSCVLAVYGMGTPSCGLGAKTAETIQ